MDRLFAFNSHLSALAAAGVPIDLGPNASNPTAEIEQLTAKIALQVSRGRAVEQVLNDDTDLPAAYRCSALTLLASDDSSAALDALCQQPSARQRLRHSARGALIAPALIGGLAYAAGICLCLGATPQLEAVYDQLGQTPNAGVLLLVWLRRWLLVWAPLLPLLLFFAAWACRRTDVLRRLSWLPAVRSYLTATARASFARQLSNLSERRIPLETAVPLAAEQAGDLRLRGGSQAFAAAIEAGGVEGEAAVDENRSRSRDLSPLLRWSLADRSDPDRLTSKLSFTADSYGCSAHRRANYWQYVGPAFFGALIGGAMVMAYGCALFFSLAELLKDLSQVSQYPKF